MSADGLAARLIASGHSAPPAPPQKSKTAPEVSVARVCCHALRQARYSLGGSFPLAESGTGGPTSLLGRDLRNGKPGKTE